MNYRQLSIKSLEIQWSNTLKQYQVEPILSQKVFQDLVKNYSRPHRYYHTLAHIHYVLNQIAASEYLNINLSAIQLAAWFHDVIYDPQAKDNEEKSAEYTAISLSKLKIPTVTINHVKNMIIATKNHQISSDNIEIKILIDADLAILGSSNLEYKDYSTSIRQEYSWVADAEYRLGRKNVLQSFLQREKIYMTKHMFLTLESKARQNIQAEIDLLSSPT